MKSAIKPKKISLPVMFADTSANDKLEFINVKILLLMFYERNHFKELLCSNVNNINK